jgi:hypothetical protein
MDATVEDRAEPAPCLTEPRLDRRSSTNQHTTIGPRASAGAAGTPNRTDGRRRVADGIRARGWWA